MLNFPELSFPFLEDIVLPRFHAVTLHCETPPAIDNVDEALRQALATSAALSALPRGARVAVAVGSRGIARLPELVASLVADLRQRGLHPFIVPAMGSHGGGTAGGQTALLASLGVTEAACGAPVHSSMDVVDLGPVNGPVHAFVDRHAAEADGIIVVVRVKPHTNFTADIESGLCKMVAVGLGKAEGARAVHIYGRPGLAELMPRIAAVTLQAAPMVCGIAVLESSEKSIVHLEAVAPEAFMDADRRLLRTARTLVASLPFEQLDMLTVIHMGKDISGTGMDNKVVGREGFRGDPFAPPHINSLVALRLTEASHGNGIGMGNADIITKSMADSLDLRTVYLNALTACCTLRARIPPVLPTEKAAMQAGLNICWQPDPQRVRACIIRSTSHVTQLWVTSPLLREVESKACEIKEACSLHFDAQGKLDTARLY